MLVACKIYQTRMSFSHKAACVPTVSGNGFKLKCNSSRYLPHNHGEVWKECCPAQGDAPGYCLRSC